MANSSSIPAVEIKSHDRPDEVRSPAMARIEIVHVGGVALARITMQPGWTWERSIQPIAKTDTCQIPHVGHLLSGRMTVRMNDGTVHTVRAGDSYSIQPGHTAWVEGDEPVHALEVMSAEQFAKPA